MLKHEYSEKQAQKRSSFNRDNLLIHKTSCILVAKRGDGLMMVRHICPNPVFFTNASANKYFLHTSLFIGKPNDEGGIITKGVCVY